MWDDLTCTFIDWIFKPKYVNIDGGVIYPNLRSGLLFLLSQCSCVKTKHIAPEKDYNTDLIELYFIKIPNDNIENLDIIQGSTVKSVRERVLGDNKDTYWGKLESYYEELPYSSVAHLTRATQDLDGIEVDDSSEIFDWITQCDFNPMMPSLVKSVVKRNLYEVEKFLMSQIS